MAESKEPARDIRESVDDLREVIEASLDNLQARINVAFPIKFEEYDAKKQTAKIKALIKGTIRKADGKIEKVELPMMEDAPVYFPGAGREEDQGGGQGGGGGGGSGGGGTVSAGSGGGSGGQQKKKGYMLSFPIKKGDEGIAIVSSRSIDNWYKKSDVQEQVSARMHDLSDVMILPGIKSKPRAEEVKDGTDEKGPELRSVNGDHKYGLDEDEEGGLYGKTKAHIKNNADKNIETEAGKDMISKAENMSRETKKVETAKAGKAIVKTAPKFIINST